MIVVITDVWKSMLMFCHYVYTRTSNNGITKVPETLILEEYNGFRKGLCFIDLVFINFQVISTRREFSVRTFITFIDYVKAFNRPDRHILWQIMFKKRFPQHVLRYVHSLGIQRY